MKHIALFLLIACGVLGCQSLNLAGGNKRLTEAQLRTKLAEYTDNFSAIIQAASDHIVATGDRETARAAVSWKAHTIPLVRRTVREKPPMDALLDLWAFSYQIHAFMNDEERGAAHAEVLDAVSDELLENIERIASDILSPQDYAEAREAVEQFALDNPMSDSLARDAQLPSEAPDSGGGGFAIVRAIPIIGSLDGLGETPRAIGEFTHVAGQLGDIAAALPEESRWQMELALYDMESRATTEELREGIDSITTSAATLTEVVATLPDDVENLLDASFENLEASREGIHETLVQAQSTVTEIDAALVHGETIASSAERTAESVARAAASLEGMSLALVELTSSDEDAEPTAAESEAEAAAPFDVNDYGENADSLREAAAEIRGLLGDVRALSDAKEYEAPIDHIFLRFVQAVIAVLIALVLYRMAMAAMAKRAE
jgi:hypothetical protein